MPHADRPLVGHPTRGRAAPGTRAKQVLRRAVPEPLRRQVWNTVVDRPVLSRMYFFLDPDVRSLRLTRHTDLVVEGYMRSANTYAVCAFEHANDAGLRLVHHLHRPGIVRRAASLGVPVLLTIREPEAVLKSMLQFDEGADAVTILDSYARFYEQLIPVLDRVVVADFAEVVADFGEVTRRINARFGTDFAPYRKSTESEREVLAAVERFSLRHFAMEDFERRVSRPSAARSDATDAAADLGERERRCLARAVAVREQVLSRR
jgi:hypothetical protein